MKQIRGLLSRVAFALLLCTFCQSDSTNGWKQVKDLKSAMYAKMKYSQTCVKLLTASGPQGCEASEGGIITAPIVRSKDFSWLPKGRRVVVVPAPDAEAFLLQLLADPALRQQVAGVLVDPTPGRPATQSAAERFPGAAYAPYDAPDYVWNPPGTGLAHKWLGLPVYMLTPGLAAETARRAAYNAENSLKGGRHVAAMKVPMEAQGDSLRCISEQGCLPVGSYSVWTAVPPLPDPFYVNATARPITLLVAQMDSNALIHDMSKAAGAALSGLIAGLVGVTMLVQSNLTATYSRQLVFAALSGEGFDYQGGRRLLFEMSLNTSFARGLRMDLIDQVVEVGQVGGAWDPASNQSSFYLHTQRGAGFGDASGLLAAAQAAATQDAAQLQAQPASSSNPGIPPSSLMALLRAKPSLSGMVLADFDSAFRNPYYQSVFDDGGNVTLRSLVDASMLVARTLHGLLAGPDTSADLPLNRSSVAGLVTSLARCLILEDPGMRCPLAAALMNPDIEVSYDGSTSAAVHAYPGVLTWLSYDPKSSSSKPNLPRFLFNYLGNLTAVPLANASAAGHITKPPAEGSACDPSYNRCPYPLACVGWRYSTSDPAGMGRCRNTTTNYLPSYSTKFVYSNRRWWVDNTTAVAFEANTSLPPDPAWTESNWPSYTPTLTVYQQESYSTQVITLVVGLVLTAATAALSWLGLKTFEKHMKSD